MSSTIALGAPCRDFYEGGLIWKPYLGSFTVIGHTANIIQGDTIVIEGTPTPQEMALLNGAMWYIKDDDQMGAQLPLLCPTPQEVKDALREANIEAIDLPEQYNPERTVPFDLYLDDDLLGLELPNLLEDALGLYSRDVRSSESYWAAWIVMGYQPDPDYDGDPDEFYDHTPGAQLVRYTWDPNQEIPPYDEGHEREYGATLDDPSASVLYLETIRDLGSIEQPKFRFHEAFGHELGHQKDSGGLAADHAEGGWMAGTYQQPLRDLNPNGYTRATIRRLRRGCKW